MEENVAKRLIFSAREKLSAYTYASEAQRRVRAAPVRSLGSESGCLFQGLHIVVPGRGRLWTIAQVRRKWGKTMEGLKLVMLWECRKLMGAATIDSFFVNCQPRRSI
jgi:hypothetical protein